MINLRFDSTPVSSTYWVVRFVGIKNQEPRQTTPSPQSPSVAVALTRRARLASSGSSWLTDKPLSIVRLTIPSHNCGPNGCCSMRPASSACRYNTLQAPSLSHQLWAQLGSTDVLRLRMY